MICTGVVLAVPLRPTGRLAGKPIVLAVGWPSTAKILGSKACY